MAPVADTAFASLRDRLLRLLASGPRESVGPDILGFDIDQPTQADSQGYVAFERAMIWLRDEGLIRYSDAVHGTVDDPWFYDVVLTASGEAVARGPAKPAADVIKPTDMRFLAQALSFETGYVMDFSDRTFGDFFRDEVGVDIDEEHYAQGGGSKGKRLRYFLQKESPARVARALRALWTYRCDLPDHRLPTADDEAIKRRYFEVVERVERTIDRPRTDAIERFAPDETLDELVASIHRDIDAGKPQAALDRLHTYCMKKFAHLLRANGLEVHDNDTLNGRVGRLFNPLRREGKVSLMSDKIMKGSVEAFEAFNKVRNDASFAHDNKILSPAEAHFIFDGVVNLLRFVKALETEHFGS
ncbi:MAG: abortive infection family protein [Pseudomonadota bacterium]